MFVAGSRTPCKHSIKISNILKLDFNTWPLYKKMPKDFGIMHACSLTWHIRDAINKRVYDYNK